MRHRWALEAGGTVPRSVLAYKLINKRSKHGIILGVRGILRSFTYGGSQSGGDHATTCEDDGVSTLNACVFGALLS